MNSHKASFFILISFVLLIISSCNPMHYLNDLENIIQTPKPTSIPVQIPEYIIYDDAAPEWTDTSWEVHADLSNLSPVYEGSFSIALYTTDYWASFSLSKITGEVSTLPYTHLRLYIHGGAVGGQELEIYFENDGVRQGNSSFPAYYISGGTIVAYEWNEILIPLEDMNCSDVLIDKFIIFDYVRTFVPLFYIDRIELITIEPTAEPTPEPTAEPGGVFVKGINLFGNAVTIEGNSWISYGEAWSSGFSATSDSIWGGGITWLPAADSDTNTMLNNMLYKQYTSFTMTQTIDNGNYDLYFWIGENYSSYTRSMNIRLEGNIVATDIGSMLKNTWIKYGPYNVDVNDGALNIEFIPVNPDAHCSGLAIFSRE